MLDVGSGNGFCPCDKWYFPYKRNQTYFGFKVLTFHKGVLPDYGQFLYYPIQDREHLQDSYAKKTLEGMAFLLITSGGIQLPRF